MRKELYFVVGFVAGCVSGYLATKSYFDKVAREEEEERRNEKKEKERKQKEEEEKTLDEMSEKAEKARKEYFGEAFREEEEWPGKEYNSMEGPHVISPEELDELAGYDLIYLTWYEQEGILVRNEVDINNGEEEMITDIAATVGEDSLERFGEFEENTIYVKDDSYRVVYSIDREVARYGEYD